MTDEQVEKIIRANMGFQMNMSGIRRDFEEHLQKPWVGLTKKEKKSFSSMLDEKSDEEVFTAIENKLKEKNK